MRSFATGSLEASVDLEAIVDPPLEASESTDHDDSCSETSPKAGHANLSVD